MRCLWKLFGLYKALGLYLLELTQEEKDRMMKEWLDDLTKP